jgi:hypothetical protein
VQEGPDLGRRRPPRPWSSVEFVGLGSTNSTVAYYAIVGGNPARVLRLRFAGEERDRLVRAA